MYKLTLLTPEKPFFEGQVSSLIAPGGSGYLEVLTNHCPLLTTLKPGHLTITEANGKKLSYEVKGGFLEVSHNHVTILADG